MPTIDVLEGFEHQVPSSLTVGVPASAGTPIYNAITVGGSISYTTGRLGGQALHVVENGSTSPRQDWPASTTRVFYGWFRVPSAPSFDRSTIVQILDASSVQCASVTVRSAANGSTIEMQCGTGTRRAGPNIADNAWHLLEFRAIAATTSWTVDWAVDGTPQTQATFTGAAANTMVRLHYGTASASHTATVDWDDVVGSVTSGDYQISSSVTDAFAVRAYVPNAEGTDVIGSSNAITFVGQSTGWQATSEWPADTSSYITYASATTGDAASNYAEMTLPDLESDVTAVWGVRADLAAFADGTGTDVLKVRALDSSNNVLAEVTDTSFDVSETTLRYWRKMLSTPGGGFLTDFNGFKFRVGLSTDTSAIPRASALMLQAAVLYSTSTNASVTTTTVVSAATVPAPTDEATADLTTDSIASTAAVPAPTVDADENPAITTTTIAVTSAIPAPTAETTAEVTTDVVVSTSSVPTPDAAATADVTTTTIASIAAVDAPTIEGTAEVTTTTVASTASVPTPTASIDVDITTTTVVVVTAIPTPTADADENPSITTATIAVTASIPDVTTEAEARASPDVIEVLAALAAPTVDADENPEITTATVAATTVVLVPGVTAEGNADITTGIVVISASVPTPTAQANAGRGAGGIVRTVVVFAPHVNAPADITTDTVAATAAVYTPDVTATASSVPSTVVPVVSIPAPDVAAPAAITTTTVAAPGAAIFQAEASWSADSVPVTVSVPTPSVQATADITTEVIAAAAAIDNDDIADASFEITLDSIAVIADVPGAGIIAYDIGIIHKKAGTTGGKIYLRAGTAVIHKKAGTIEIVKNAGSDPYIEKRGSA